MPTMVIAGASGVVGRHLLARALRDGWQLRQISRGTRPAAAGAQVFGWDAAAAALERADLLVNLAGASLGEGRLGKKHKQRVLGSRLDATNALVKAHGECQAPPPVWLQASAVGYYGDTGEAEIGEDAASGDDFLADVCVQWERAAAQVAERTRLVHCRIGLVLAWDAPAFQKLLTPLLWGLGGPLGSGRQWWAWIHADDLADAMLFLAAHGDASGPYNLTAPEPVRQLELTRQMGIVVGRPTLLPAPAFGLRLVLGEVADRLLLPSCRAVPRRLAELGFQWKQASLGRALLSIFDAAEVNDVQA